MKYSSDQSPQPVPSLKWKAPNSPERYFRVPTDPNIQLVNYRSKWKPYLILETGVKIEGF